MRRFIGRLLVVALVFTVPTGIAEPAQAAAPVAGGGLMTVNGIASPGIELATAWPVTVSFAGSGTGTVGGGLVTCSISGSATGSATFPPGTFKGTGGANLSCSGPGLSLSCSAAVEVTYPPLCIMARARCQAYVSTPVVTGWVWVDVFIDLCVPIPPLPPIPPQPVTSFSATGPFVIEGLTS